ncbi:MAG: carbon starvation protein A [Anaerohalosphaeraceae bacterium]|nr:carbon starvation protein A [Anaerohalosphaeraceae bacterium]
METLLLMIFCFFGYIVAYHTYGKFLARKIFNLHPNTPVPSNQLYDGIDYVPAKKSVIFGHHFTSIAGTGPIVGPAIGIIYGWAPAVLWIMLGSIFMGAVHDFGSLVVSVRNEGKSISEIADKYINRRVRFIFFAIVFLVLLIVIAIFGVVIAVVFARFPSSVLAVWLQIPIAIALGFAIYKRQFNLLTTTIIAIIAMYAAISFGSILPLTMPTIFNIPPTGVWTIILLAYAWVASTLPVTTLLQPRDYINAWQLFIMMALLAVGVVFVSFADSLPLVAPAFNPSPQGAPPMMPFLFIIIACGAVSGFHSLVATGTSPKQIAKEPDTLFVGFGSMLTEGALAILVIICVAAGIGIAYEISPDSILTGRQAWEHHYSSWSDAAGLGAKLDAVVIGAANIMASLGINASLGATLMGVFIASFAGTTLDTSVRLQRYVVSEMAHTIKFGGLKGRYAATTFATVTAAILAFAAGANGKGAMNLWPLFGTVNQLLAALALLVVTMYLKSQGRGKFWVTLLPCLVMLTLTLWALVYKLCDFWSHSNWMLFVIGGIIFALAVWMTVETFLLLLRPRPTPS